MKGQIEMMSPAGSFESLMAAIQGGADSVYFGIEQLNIIKKNEKPNPIPNFNTFLHKL